MSEKYDLTEAQLKKMADPIIQTLIKKNQDYGGASFDLGLTGNMVHLWDKVKRYKTLVERKLISNGEPNFESIQDTLKDIIGYSLIGLIILENESKDQNG
jgi:hypothetical protein